MYFGFDYVSENDFFEYLLNYYAVGFCYDLKKRKGRIELVLSVNESEAKRFCDSLNELPQSVFLRGFEVKSFDDLLALNAFEESNFSAQNDAKDPSNQPQNKINPFKRLQKSQNSQKNSRNSQFFSPKIISKDEFLTKIKPNFAKKDFLTSLNSKAYLKNGTLLDNEWGEFMNLSLSFDNQSYESIDKSNFNEILSKASAALSRFKSIFIKNKLGIYEFELFCGELNADFLIPTDISNIPKAFVCTNENAKLLASLEKPLVKLRLNAIFREKYKLKLNEFKTKLPQNLFLFALANSLFKQNLSFICVKKLKNFQDDFEVTQGTNTLFTLRGFEFINEKAREIIFSKDDLNLARLSYALSRFEKPTLAFELSQNYDDIVLLDKKTALIRLKLPLSATLLQKDIENSLNGSTLFVNFSQKFPFLQGDFGLKNSFFSLFGLIGLLLRLDNTPQSAAARVFELSDKSKMLRGVRVDFRFCENGFDFDYVRTIKSVMSFMLAGAEPQNIAFGAVESLVYFLRDLFDEHRQNERLAVLCGSLFEFKSLRELALKHIKPCESTDVPLFV